MNISITQHAVERYRERVDPTHSLIATKRMLILKAQLAHKLRERTRAGQELWVADDTVFVCKVDPDGSRVAVTAGRYEETVDPDQQAAEDAELDRQYWASQRAAEPPMEPLPKQPLTAESIEILQDGIRQRNLVIQKRLLHGAKEEDKGVRQLRRRQEKAEAELLALMGTAKT